MLGRLVQPEIQTLIESRDLRELREVLTDLSVPDVADIISDVEAKDRAVIFRMLSRPKATDVFEHLDPEDQESVIESLRDGEVATYLNDMAPDDRTELLEELPDRVARRVLRLLTPEERAISEVLLAYPEDSVGRRMTPEYVKVKQHVTVGACIELIRSVAEQKETVDYVYIVDATNHPVGVVSLRELVFTRDDRELESLCAPRDEMVKIRATDDQEGAVGLMRHYDIKAIPVVDSTDRLVGIVTWDDLMDVQEEEATEDMQLMSGVVPTESTYVGASFFNLLRNRLGALLILAITATIAGVVLDQYQMEFRDSDRFANLIPFIIVLMAASGNTGSQVGTLFIRAVAVEEVDGKDIRFIALRELFMGIAIGATLGVVVACMGILFFRDLTLGEAMVTGGALAISVAACNMVGVLVPFGLRLLKRDPAFFSNPLITTISDFLALYIFFESARFLLGS